MGMIHIRCKDRQERKSALMDAALTLFSERDFHEVTVEEIAERAGLSKGTVYLYFENKENLFLSIIQDRTDALISRIRRAIRSHRTYEERLNKLVLSWLGFFEEQKAYFKLVHSEKSRIDARSKQSMHVHMQQSYIEMKKLLTGFIEEGIALNLLRKVKPEVLVKALQGMLNGFIFESVFMQEKSSLVGETQSVLDIFSNGAFVKSHCKEVS